MSAPERSQAIPHELLLGQAGFLRRLARDLVRDPHAADDAVQDAWLAALEHPPRHQGNLRAWLGTILRNIVAQRGEARSRREHHEAQAGRASEERPGGGSGETVRLVTDLVLSLEEPYRATVLARYFEELTPAQIAERERVPLATVKSRLQRALEMLRARLQRENGTNWSACLVALLTPGRIGKGALLMSLKSKIAVGAVLLLAAWVAVYEWTAGIKPADPSADPHSTAKLETPREAPAKTESVLEADPHQAPRGAAESAPPAAPTARVETPDTLLYGAVLDPSGAPWRGLLYERVMVDDASGRTRILDTQEDGTYAFRGLPFGSYWLRVDGDELLDVEKRIELRREQPHMQCDFTVERAPLLKFKLTTPEGENFVDAMKRAREKNDDFRGLHFPFPVATLGPPEELFKEGGPRSNGLNGVGWYWGWGPKTKSLPKEYSGVLVLTHALPVRVSLIGNQKVLQTRMVQPGEEEIVFELSLEEYLARAATISLQVVEAETLAPIQGARVDLEGSARSLQGWTSDADGTVWVRNHQPGEFQLRVSAPGHGDFTKVFTATAGTATELGQIGLWPEIQFEARVQDPSGASCLQLFKIGVLDPVTREIAMEWRSSEEIGDPRRETTTWQPRSYGCDNDGVLKIRHLGRRVYVLRAFDPERQVGRADPDARWTCGNILLDLRSGVAPKEMVIQLERASLLVLHVKDENFEGLRYRVIATDGLECAAAGFRRSAPISLPLPQGSYRVQLLESGGRTLSEQTVALGAGSLTVELAR